MEFTHLQVRSAYSLLNSSISLSQLVEFAKAKQLSTLALVEDSTMHSAIKFYSACQEAKIKPLIGMSLKIKGDSFVDEWTLLAKNEEGYQALLKFASMIALEKEGVEIEAIIKRSKHLIICTSGEHGVLASGIKAHGEVLISSYYEQYLSRVPQLYFGLSRINSQTFKQSQEIIQLGKQFQVPVVALHDVRYLQKQDANSYRFLQAIKNNVLLSKFSLENEDRYFIKEAQMKELFNDCPEAITAVSDIISLCEVRIKLNQKLLPKFPNPGQVPSNEFLRTLCQKGLTKRYGFELTPIHYKRLNDELATIDQMGFSDYFLIVWDFVKYAKSNQIAVGPGRGSAAGSLVAYVLGITDVDPLKYDLLFERFLNPERITMPDIDIDFQDNRRDEVIKYVQNKYGDQYVVQIATFGTFQSRSAWRDLARIHDIETKLINEVAKFIYSGSTLAAIYEQDQVLREFLKAYPQLETVYKEAIKIEKLPRHTSIHAAGVIISDRELTDYTALMEGPTGIYLSQYEAEDLEAIGLLKMDFLGLKNLTMIQQILKLIKDHRQSTFSLNQIEFDDNSTFELISKGQTTGVFQLESEGMRQVLKSVRPTCLEEIIACNALFRPGPMENIPLFAARKNKEQQVEYYHPDLMPILEKTYGIIIYQEQIMQLAHVISGYTLSEADVLRRAVSKKSRDVLQREEQHFIENAINRGYSKETAEVLYALILKFADYGFNRSHAVAYSVIAYQMAYLKVNYPCYFMAVALSNVIGSERLTVQYIKEAKQLGLVILTPSINKSQVMYDIESEGIRFSLLPIKNIGLNIARQLIDGRQKGKYQSFYDFVMRTKGFMNQRVYESLIDVGALDEFGYSRATLHQNLIPILDFSKYDGGLFETEFVVKEVTKDFDQTEIMKREKELLGFYLNSHPVSFITKKIAENGWSLPRDLLSLNSGSVTCVGLVEKVRQIRDKNGNLMGFMEISDEETALTVTIFSKVYQSEYRSLVGQIIVVQGTISQRNNETNLNLSKIISLL